MPNEMLLPPRAVVTFRPTLQMLPRIDPLRPPRKKPRGGGKPCCFTDPSHPKWRGLIRSKTTATQGLWCLLQRPGQSSPRGGSLCRRRAALLLTQRLLLPRGQCSSGSRSQSCSSRPRHCSRTMKMTRCLSRLPSLVALLHPSHPRCRPILFLSRALALRQIAQRNSHLLHHQWRLRGMGQLGTEPPGPQRRPKRGKGGL